MFSSTIRRVALRGNSAVVGSSSSGAVTAATATAVAAGAGSFGPQRLQQQQVRQLNLHEYQSAAIMKEAGVNVPFGIAAHSVDEAVAAAKEIGDDEVVIKYDKID